VECSHEAVNPQHHFDAQAIAPRRPGCRIRAGAAALRRTSPLSLYLSPPRARRSHLQPTALVHEAYLRLVDQKEVHWQNRSHFFGIAAQQMRRILLDYARSHKAAKRGGLVGKLSLEEVMVAAQDKSGDVVALDETLSRLEAIDSQQAKIVELRVFGGLTVEEAAEVLSISPATVKRDWSMAKAWLTRELKHN